MSLCKNWRARRKNSTIGPIARSLKRALRHPLAPLAKTIAAVNIEQVGRTDDSEGPEISKATVTSFDFSTMTKSLVEAGNLVG